MLCTPSYLPEGITAGWWVQPAGVVVFAAKDALQPILKVLCPASRTTSFFADPGLGRTFFLQQRICMYVHHQPTARIPKTTALHSPPRPLNKFANRLIDARVVFATVK